MRSRDGRIDSSVDEMANKFVLGVVGRPSMGLSTTTPFKEETSAGMVKDDICEGEDDFLDLTLNGMLRPFFRHGRL